MTSPKCALFSLLALSTVSLNHSITLPDTIISEKQSAMTAIKMEHLEFDWTLVNFSLLSQELGEYLESPAFYNRNNDVGWVLRLYPDGYDIENFVGIYIIQRNYRATKEKMRIRCKLSLIVADDVELTTTDIFLFGKTVIQGTDKLIDRLQLREITMPNDTFTIRAEVDMPSKVLIQSKILNASMSTEPLEEELARDMEESRWSDHFDRLLKDPKLTDVSIIVSNETFPAHKVILAARSPVFAGMFEGQELMENSSSVVFIENMEPDAVKAMLEFIYTDEVAELNPFASRLLQAARDYKLPRLITMCEMVLYKSLDIENAAELYVLANECGSIKLEENIKKFIHENFGDVSATEGYKHLPVTLLLEL